MTKQEWQAFKTKIDKEFPIRCKLAQLAGFKANPKNIYSLMNSESKSAANAEEEKKVILDEPFTDDQLKNGWLEFAETKKVYQGRPRTWPGAE